jgi:hypothetical protein
MKRHPLAPSIDLLFIAALAAAPAIGCVVGSGSADDQATSDAGETGDPGACGGAGSYSHVSADGTCLCDAGYNWVNPADADDYRCEEIGKPGSTMCDGPHNVLDGDTCSCEASYLWCDPADSDDYTCCAGPTSGTDTGLADTTASDSIGDTGVDPDPADCTTEGEGAVFCSNTAAMGPAGSQFWTCMGGSWVEQPGAADVQCAADGYDFSYGCVDDGELVTYVCGNGPGTACGDEVEPMCVNDDVIHACFYGRLTEDSCTTVCSTIGDAAGITYDNGFCDAEAIPVDCFCCDAGEEGCPG